MPRELALRWWRVLREAIDRWLECNAFTYAGSLAFYTLFSLAPVFIIAVSVIGVVLGEDAAQGEIVTQLEDLMGREAAVAVEQTVARSRIDEAGLLPTILGSVALLVGATTVFAQMQYSLNAIWGVAARPGRNSLLAFVKSRLLSLAIVLAIGFVLLVSLLLGVVLRGVLHFADAFLPEVAVLLSAADVLLTLVAMWLLFCAIFRVLPDVVLRWRDVAVGALVTAFLFSIGRYAISAYLANTATASAYGAAGSVVLVLLWVYYSSLMLLFGAAFTRAHVLGRGGAIVPRKTAALVRRELVTDVANS